MVCSSWRGTWKCWMSWIILMRDSLRTSISATACDQMRAGFGPVLRLDLEFYS